MPVALSLYLYGLYQKKVEKAFDANNKVLSQKEIEALFKKEDVQKTLQIFRSAVVDHKAVDGITCYSRELQEEALTDVLLILDKLIDPEESISYVQILAWNSLGRIGDCCSKLVKDKRESIMSAFGGSVASVLGVLIFLDKMLETSQKRRALSFIKEGKSFIKYRVQKALINYYLFKSPYFGNPVEENPNLESDIKRFLLNNRSFTQSDTNEGLRHIGIIPWNKEESFWDNAPHVNVGKRVMKAANDYIAPIGAFSRGNDGKK